MRRPRVGFREFLLLVTLASLITAAFAIRARTSHHLSAQEHAYHAYEARQSVAWWEERIRAGRAYLETMPRISEDWAAGCDVRLMPSIHGPEIPIEGKDLIIVADRDGTLFLRMFDGDGRMVVDTTDGLYSDEHRAQFASLWPPHELTLVEKLQVIAYVIRLLDRQRADYQKGLKDSEDLHAKAVAEAEHHGRLARSYGP
jgi:hypothetical protein